MLADATMSGERLRDEILERVRERERERVRERERERERDLERDREGEEFFLPCGRRSRSR